MIKDTLEDDFNTHLLVPSGIADTRSSTRTVYY
jgi:hypothetical protein